MAGTWAWRAIDGGGQVRTGTLDASDPQVVTARLREMGLWPVSVDRQDESVLSREIHLPVRRTKVKLSELAVLSRQLATMIDAGLPLLRSLTVLSDQTSNAGLAGILRQVRQDVEGGAPLSQALEAHPHVFDAFYVSMVRAGELGGVLDTILSRLATSLDRSASLRRRVRSAMTYPAAIASLAVLIVGAIIVFLVPMFVDIYEQVDGQLPLPTRLLLAVSGAVTGALPLVLAALTALVLGGRAWARTTGGRRWLDRRKLGLPLLGVQLQKIAVARFANNLGTLLAAGVPILDALDITARTVRNVLISDAVVELQAAVREGESLAEPMAQLDVFPPMVVQMVRVGEESGELDAMLARVAEHYDAEVEAATAAITSLIEPLLVVFLAGTVGAIVVALYLPIFRLIDVVR